MKRRKVSSVAETGSKIIQQNKMDYEVISNSIFGSQNITQLTNNNAHSSLVLKICSPFF